MDAPVRDNQPVAKKPLGHEIDMANIAMTVQQDQAEVDALERLGEVGRQFTRLDQRSRYGYRSPQMWRKRRHCLEIILLKQFAF